MRSMASLSMRAGNRRWTAATIASSSACTATLNARTRLDRDVPLEVEWGLRQKVAKGTSGGEGAGEQGRNRSRSCPAERRPALAMRQSGGRYLT